MKVRLMRLFAKVLNKLSLIKYFNFNINTTINKNTFKIPILGGLGYSNYNISEPWMIKVLEILSKNKNGAYLDVGVNVGQTLLKLKSVNPDMKYLGFEPNASCVYYANKLVNTNKFKNVSIYPCGISNENNIYELNFYCIDESDSSASMIENFREKSTIVRKEFISCYNLSGLDLVKNFPLFSVIKIDVEGAELVVLQGLEFVILRDNPVLQIEVLPVYDENNTERLSRQTQIENLLKGWDYIIFRIIYSKDRSFEALKELESIGIHSNLDWCEYLFVPKRESENLKKLFLKTL